MFSKYNKNVLKFVQCVWEKVEIKMYNMFSTFLINVNPALIFLTVYKKYIKQMYNAHGKK